MQSVILRRVAKELKELSAQPIEGIVVYPNEADLTEVTATIMGPADTPFAGGEFKIKLKMGSDFPQAPPKGFFLTKVFHPNVAPSTGEICVNTLKRDWRETHTLQHILLTIKCLLMVPNAESSLNEEAGRLLLEDWDAFASRARTWTAIHAQPREEKQHQPAAMEAKEAKEDKGAENGAAEEKTTMGELSPNPKEAKVSKVVRPQPPNASAAKRGLKRL